MHDRTIYDNLLRMLAVFSAVSALSLLSACASSEDVGRVQWQLNEMKSRIVAMEERMPTGQKQFEGIEESQQATSRAVSDLFIRIQELTKDVQQINGQLEEERFLLEQRLKDVEMGKGNVSTDVQELKVAIEDLKSRMKNLEESRTPPLLKETTAERETGGKEGEPTRTRIKSAYDSAYQSFKDGKMGEAREKFTTFIKDFPDNEYIDNALFWIAETHYREGNFADAILAYEDLFMKYPESDKVSGAMLKQGLAFFSLNDWDTGRLILEKLLQKFPDSEHAVAAKKKLEEAFP